MTKILFLIGCLFAFTSVFCMDDDEPGDENKSEFGDRYYGSSSYYGQFYQERELPISSADLPHDFLEKFSKCLSGLPEDKIRAVMDDQERVIYALRGEFENSLRTAIENIRTGRNKLSENIERLFGICTLDHEDYYHFQRSHRRNCVKEIGILHEVYASMYDGTDNDQKITEAKNSLDDICAGFELLVKGDYFTMLLKGEYDGAHALVNSYVAAHKKGVFDISGVFSIGESKHFKYRCESTEEEEHLKGRKEENITQFMANLDKQRFEGLAFDAKEYLESGVVPDNVKVFVHLCNAQDEEPYYHDMWIRVKDGYTLPFFDNFSGDCGQFLSLFMTASNMAYSMISGNHELEEESRLDMLDELRLCNLCEAVASPMWNDPLYAGMQEAFAFYRFAKFMQQTLGFTNGIDLKAASVSIDEIGTF